MSIESYFGKIRRTYSRSEWLIRLLDLERETDLNLRSEIANAQQPTGLIMVQIDGLGYKQLEAALANGEMPFLEKLLAKNQYTCRTLYSGLPSSTPAVQGELFYGVEGVVPAFGFRHNADGQVNRMYDPVVACRVQKSLEAKGQPLLTGGSAYSNIYTGGAKESHFCAASMGWDDVLRSLKARNWIMVVLLNIPTILRIFGLMLMELGIALFDMLRGVLSGKSIVAEIKFMVARVAVSIFLRDMITIGASVDISRGLPIIHLNYLGYDEQSHRRGPQSKFAHWALKGIDRSIEKLWKVAQRSGGKHYDFWIYSDHGQEHTIPYEKLTGNSIDTAVRLAAGEGFAPVPDPASRNQSNAATTYEPLLKGIQSFNRKPNYRVGDVVIPLADITSPKVVAMGPVGHIYFDAPMNSSLLSIIASTLVNSYEVPAVVQLAGDERLLVYTHKGVLTLPGQEQDVFGENHPFLSVIATDLYRLCKHVDAGDLVLLGCVDGVPAISFPMENGAHAGAGPNETKAFAIVPENETIEENTGGFIRPKAMHKAALIKMAKLRNKKSVTGQHGEVVVNTPSIHGYGNG